MLLDFAECRWHRMGVLYEGTGWADMSCPSNLWPPSTALLATLSP